MNSYFFYYLGEFLKVLLKLENLEDVFYKNLSIE